MYVMGLACRAQVDLTRKAGFTARALQDETGETAQFPVLDQDQVLVLLKVEGRHPLRIISSAGSRVAVKQAAAGRFLVPDMKDTPLRAILSRTVRHSPSGGAETGIDRLTGRIGAARQIGHAIEINETDETDEHAGCIAAPVLDVAGHCIAALGIVVPKPPLTDDRMPTLVGAVRQAAARLSRRLGQI